MRKALLMIVMIAIFLPFVANSVPLSDLTGEQKAQTLRVEESIKNLVVNQVKPTLAPSSESGMNLATEIEKFGPNVIVEALYLYKKPATQSGSSWTDAERVIIFNILRSLSTLSGIEYYSASRGAMRVFYEKSYAVAGPDSKEPIADPIVASVPEQATLFAVQKDLTFGENRYRYDYKASVADLSFTQTNLTHMSYGIIPLIGREALRTSVLVSYTPEGYLLYAVSATKTTLLPGVEGKMKTSFSNRADAIYRWFSQRADAALAEAGSKK